MSVLPLFAKYDDDSVTMRSTWGSLRWRRSAEQKTEIGYKPDMGEDLGKGAALNVHFLIHSRISGINLDVY